MKEHPYNISAEQFVLGAILANNESLNRVNEFLKEDHFYEPAHRKIFSLINKFLNRGICASVISLKNVCDEAEELKAVEGSKYLMKITTLSASVFNILDYAKIIYECFIRRQLITLAEDTLTDAYKHESLDVFRQIENLERKLFFISENGTLDKGFVNIEIPISESLQKIDKALKQPGNITGISTGFKDVDKKLSGFQSSDLIILAARPSMGKTALAINFAYNAALKFMKVDDTELKITGSVGFFSLEMSSEQIASRILSMQSGIDSTRLRNGMIREDEYTKIRSEAEYLSRMPFYIDDTPALSISSIRSRARRYKKKHNMSILFIDYLQLIKGSSSDNRVLEISEITQGLKAIAKELNIPVIALSQLSRAVEQREDKRPMLSDLRESGSIEQDADLVMFIYREEYYLERKQPSSGDEKIRQWQNEIDSVKGKADIIVAKHRNGSIGNIELNYNSSCSKFDNIDQLRK